MLHNTSTWFPAILKDGEGKVLATGQSSILLEQRAINFTSDFVPIYPLGEHMEIDRLDESGREVHRFVGKVYLSDKTFMRITDVDDTLLSGSENIYCDNLPFTGMLEKIEAPEPNKWFWKLKKGHEPKTPHHIMVPIIELTDKQLVFLFDNSVSYQEGDRFRLTAHMPLILPETVIEIEKAFLFGVNSSYICNFLDLSEENRQILRHFLVQYNIKHNKLF